MTAVFVVSLMLLTAAQSSVDVGKLGKYVGGLENVKMQSTTNDKMVQQLQLQLQAKTEENNQNLLKVQNLQQNLKNATQQFTELEAREKLINATIEELGRKLNESLRRLEDFSDKELHLKNILNDYYRDKDWRGLRKNLENLLDKDSEAYQQLQLISYSHGYPLWKIGSYCMVPLTEVLVSGSQGPNISESDGDTILHGAAEGGCMNITIMLLDKGADINARDNGGSTALIIAARYGRLRMVRLLEERGADINAADNKDMTSLHLAAEGGHLEVVKYLVEVGEDYTTKDKENKTPLGRARARGRTSVVQYLSQLMPQDNTTSTTPMPFDAPYPPYGYNRRTFNGPPGRYGQHGWPFYLSHPYTHY